MSCLEQTPRLRPVEVDGDGPLSQRATIANGWWMSIFCHKTTEIRKPICTVHTAGVRSPVPLAVTLKRGGARAPPEYMAPAPLQLGVKFFYDLGAIGPLAKTAITSRFCQ